VGKGQIKYILTNLGEKMSEEEVEELFKSTIDTGNNEVDYRGRFLSCHEGEEVLTSHVEFVKTIAEN
jgi:Ca2+-binding EF-hand superfamily protein